mgnify:FL=1
MIPSVLIIGTGEYTTGYIAADKTLESDKSAGVVALSIFDLKRRGKVLDVGLCGVNGTKFPAIRRHMADNIGPLVYEGMDLSCSTYPDDATCDSRAYEGALDNFKAGDCAIVFTPDDTHFDIALACINKGLHVLITKPIVKSLEQHVILKKAAEKNKVLVAVEVHKRLDPFYADARDRIRNNDKMGSFQHMNAYMSQPKHQLETFKAWAGKSSDISYYLNSHHVDFAEWCLAGKSRAIRVTASASYGVARSLGVDTEDTITLSVVWENLKDSSIGTGLYTASWVAPVTDVHSQQRFFYMGSKGEIKCDQAHRGYNVSTDDAGYARYVYVCRFGFLGIIPTQHHNIQFFLVATHSS